MEREAAKAVREKERAEKAASLARQKAARDSEKALQLSQKGKRKASRVSSQSNKRQKRIAATVDVAEPSGGASPPPAIMSDIRLLVSQVVRYKAVYLEQSSTVVDGGRPLSI